MNETNIRKQLKRISTELRLYKLTQKLQYKAKTYGIKYKSIDEYGTSKMCSYCGSYDKNLGSSKIYNCQECKKIIDRDHNSARNFILRNLQNK